MGKNINMNMIYKFVNKIFYSYMYPIVTAIIILLIYLIKKLDVITLVILYIISIVYWILKLTIIPKNRSKKYGILIAINNGEHYNENISSMFKKISFSLQDDFKIYVFNNNFIRNINNDKKREKIFFKKKYHMILNLYSLTGKENSENVCSVTNKDITFLTPINIQDAQLIKNLENEFNFGFKKIIKLSEKNSLIDITTNADLMTLSLRYFVSIIYIIFNKIDLAEKELKNMDFSTVPPDDKTIQYLRKSVVRRHIDICYVKIIKHLREKKYLYQEKELAELEKLITNFSSMAESDSSFSDIRYLANDAKSKLYYAKGDYFKALNSLNNMRKKNLNDYSITLSTAFVEINNGNIKGFNLYKKVSKRKDVDLSIIDECIAFIDVAMKNKIHDINLLKICKGMLIYYWKDKQFGIEIINESLGNVKSEEIKNYLIPRFKNIRNFEK